LATPAPTTQNNKAPKQAAAARQPDHAPAAITGPGFMPLTAQGPAVQRSMANAYTVSSTAATVIGHSMPAVGGLSQTTTKIQASLNDPSRFDDLNTLFDPPPNPRGTAVASRPYTPGNGPGTTETLIFNQLKTNLKPIAPDARPTVTAKADIDRVATAIIPVIKSFYKYITVSPPLATILAGFKVYDEAAAQRSPRFMRGYTLNHIASPRRSDFSLYNVSDADATALVTRINSDAALRTYFLNRVTYLGGFRRGGMVQINKRNPKAKRNGTIIHECIHFFTSPIYEAWSRKLKSNTLRKRFTEGITEYFTRKLITHITANPIAGITPPSNSRTNYQSRYESVRDDIASRIGDDDLERAFFGGEVWRLDHYLGESKSQFEAQIGIGAGSTGAVEIAESAISKGFVRQHDKKRFDLMGYGIVDPELKTEHKTFLTSFITSNRLLGARVAGHASPAEPKKDQNKLAMDRAKKAIDFMETQKPANGKKLIFLPRGVGARNPSVNEKNAIDRAYNRRVDVRFV